MLKWVRQILRLFSHFWSLFDRNLIAFEASRSGFARVRVDVSRVFAETLTCVKCFTAAEKREGHYWGREANSGIREPGFGSRKQGTGNRENKPPACRGMERTRESRRAGAGRGIGKTNPRHAGGWSGHGNPGAPGQAGEPENGNKPAARRGMDLNRDSSVFAPTGRWIVATGGATPLSAPRNPWERLCSTHPPQRGGGIAGHGHPFGSPKNLLRPSGAKKENKTIDSFSSSAFHGFRVGSPRDRAASPVATVLRPSGADVLNHELSTGCAPPARRPVLHPRLQSAAPLGRIC